MNSVFKVPALNIPVESVLTLPGSKSQANRAIICAALADGITTITNATPCDDVAVMVENLQKMGFDLEWEDRSAGVLRISGKMPTRNTQPVTRNELFCGNAGTTLRFLTSLACIVPGVWTITGDEHMCRRPVADLTNALRSLGAEIEDTNGCPPVRINGGPLRGGYVKLKATVSSQYLTSLLLVAPKLKEGLRIELDGSLASAGYVSLTGEVMNDFGVPVSGGGDSFRVEPANYRARPKGYEIEGDWSAAGAWLVLNSLTGSSIDFTNLNLSSGQSDRQVRAAIDRLKTKGDVSLDATLIPDQVMNLAVMAALRNGRTTITGAGNLRYKETNRLKVLVSELKKAGVEIEERADGVVISGQRSAISGQQKPVTLDPSDDHRMAMCFAIIGLIRGGILVRGPECVAKSYPRFFRDLEQVISSPKPISIVGMRGAGKSHFGRRLAARLKLEHADADHVFEKKFGPIRPFVEAKGWTAFRKNEEEIVSSLLRPGIVLSCGGGAIESSKTRSALASRSIGIWIEASETELVKRLNNGKRPPLTGLALKEEVQMFLKKRSPYYQEVSKIRIPANLPFSRQIPYAIKKLESLCRI